MTAKRTQDHYAWSTEEDDRSSWTFAGSREQAIDALIARRAEDGPLLPFDTLGQIARVEEGEKEILAFFLQGMDASNVLGEARAWACDTLWEGGDETFLVTDEAEKELDALLTKWARKHLDLPSWFLDLATMPIVEVVVGSDLDLTTEANATTTWRELTSEGGELLVVVAITNAVRGEKPSVRADKEAGT